jgi:hypothetical protein
MTTDMRSPFSSSTRPQRDIILAWSLGLLLFAAYLLVYRGGFHSVDEVSMFAVTESLVKFGQPNTDQIAWTQWTTTQREAQGFFGIDGHVYSKKGIGLSLLMAPLYWIGLVIPQLGMLQTASLTNLLITAATGGLLFLVVRRLSFEPFVAAATALLYGTASIAAVYSKYLFSEPLAGLLLLGAAYFLIAFRQDRMLWQPAIAGLLGGMAVTTRANNLFLVPFLGLYLLACLAFDHAQSSQALDDKQTSRTATNQAAQRLLSGTPAVISIIVGLIPPAALLLGYNWIRSGNPLQTGYDLTIFSPNILFGLYKLLLSPLRGLFIYSPILLLVIVGFVWLWRRRPWETAMLVSQAAVTILLFSAWTSGEGLSWGSRFLVPIVPLLCVGLAPIVAQARAGRRITTAFLVGLFTLSLLIQISGLIINPWVFLAQVQESFGGEFFLEKTAALADFKYVQPLGQLSNWNVSNSDLAWWQPWGTDTTSLSLACLILLLATVNLVAQVRRWKVARPLLAAAVILTILGSFIVLARYYVNDRQFGPPDDGFAQALDAAATRAAAADRIVTVAPYHYHVAMNRFKARIPLIGFAQQDPPLPPTAHPLLEDAAVGENTWLVTVGFPPAAANNAAEEWLCHHLYKANDTWYKDARLVQFGTPPDTMSQGAAQALFASGIDLVETRFQSAAAPGQVLEVEINWVVVRQPAADLQAFLQLLSEQGQVVAQHDSSPVGGYEKSSAWTPGQTIVDRHGVVLPESLPAGAYQLVTGLYDPLSGERLLTEAGKDFVEVGIVAVQSP